MMLPLAADWATISSLGTAGGTLVLAIATFAAVRSSNRSARISEIALQEQRRPVLAPSRLEDPIQKMMFVDGHWVHAGGGRAVVEHIDGIVYLAISLRNVGSGIAVCQGWSARSGLATSRTVPAHAAVEEFHLQSRDLYVPAGDIGMWQGALRNPDDPVRAEVIDAIESQQPISVELLYSDQVGRPRTITRFGLVHVTASSAASEESWLASMNRHWYLDWDGPRPERDALAATAAVLRDQEAVAERRAAAQSEAADADGDVGVEVAPDGTGVAEIVRADSPRA
jgi:hypothetical protein